MRQTRASARVCSSTVRCSSWIARRSTWEGRLRSAGGTGRPISGLWLGDGEREACPASEFARESARVGDPAFAEEIDPPGGLDRLGVGAAERQGRDVERLGLAEHVFAARTRPLDGEGGRVGSGVICDAHDRVPDEGGGSSIELGRGQFEVRDFLGCV